MQTTQLPLRVHAAGNALGQPGEDARLETYNAVFSELGLRFRWNMDTLNWLDGLDCDCEKARIATYIETCQPHLLKAYDANFLSQLIDSRKLEHFRAFAQPGSA